MNLLITGASGFVGSNLVKYLQINSPGVNVSMLVRNKSGSGHEILWNELQPAILDTIDVIVHLAGKAHDTKNNSNEEEYFKVNYEMTRNLFDLFINSESKKFIFISSVKAAADTVKGILNEEQHPTPATAYGRSKLKAEKYIIDNIPTNKQYYILRPCMIHGPGNKGNLNLLYQFVKRGIPYPLAAYHNERSFLSVENLCFVITQLIRKDIKSGTYQVADDETLSTNELIRIIGDGNRNSVRLLHVPKGWIRFTARLGDRLKLPLNSDRLKKLTESYKVSNNKIKNALGISQLPVRAKDGLLKTILSFSLKKQ